MTQSQLARAAQVPQSTINTLINGDSRWSPHLLRIARALKTTPAYLTGETDDPESDLPDVVPLDSERRELVESFDHLDRADQTALLQLARTLARKSGGTIHAPAPFRYQVQRQGQSR